MFVKKKRKLKEKLCFRFLKLLCDQKPWAGFLRLLPKFFFLLPYKNHVRFSDCYFHGSWAVRLEKNFCYPTETLTNLESFSEGLWTVAQNQFLCLTFREISSKSTFCCSNKITLTFSNANTLHSPYFFISKHTYTCIIN